MLCEFKVPLMNGNTDINRIVGERLVNSWNNRA